MTANAPDRLSAALRRTTFDEHPMTVERLRASLADRYRIGRELGAGGMATVYVIPLYIDYYQLQVSCDAHRSDQRPH